MEDCENRETDKYINLSLRKVEDRKTVNGDFF